MSLEGETCPANNLGNAGTFVTASRDGDLCLCILVCRLFYAVQASLPPSETSTVRHSSGKVVRRLPSGAEVFIKYVRNEVLGSVWASQSMKMSPLQKVFFLRSL
ncbi:hypothetical protein [Argonema antarcticum]|uniref:hypothetical protein n=1 Tax=Argonema antarcticum TaxID=2942763 RepID=UPI0020111B6C|nr:hypothetical protein [Argonema antarcticum]MCL1469784.1 hypothetical protein [Argonema antarcticum A004/B2]